MAKRKAARKKFDADYAMFDPVSAGLPFRVEQPMLDDAGEPVLLDPDEWIDSLRPMQLLLITALTIYDVDGDLVTSALTTEREFNEVVGLIDDVLDNLDLGATDDCGIAISHTANQVAQAMSEGVLPAIKRGEIFAAVCAALVVGYRLCQLEVLPYDDAAKVGKESLEGAKRGQVMKQAKATQRREETQEAVRDRWKKYPKRSLSAIQQALSKLDGKPFGGLRTIQTNTAGMSRQE